MQERARRTVPRAKRRHLQGMGYSGEAMLAGVSELIARVLVAFVLVGRIGFNGVCCANPAAWVFADVVLLVLYFREMRHIRSAQTGVQPEVAQTKIHRKLSSAHACR